MRYKFFWGFSAFNGIFDYLHSFRNFQNKTQAFCELKKGCIGWIKVPNDWGVDPFE